MSVPGVTLSGNLKTITGVADAGTVTITLQNYGSNPPQIVGTSAIAAVTTSVTAAADGSWSVPLWGNNQIAPANTYYTIVIASSTGAKVWSAAYLINSGTYDITALAPLSASVPTPLPNGVIFTNPTGPQQINNYGLTVPSLTAQTAAITALNAGSVIAGDPIADVREFGAVGDGVTNDTAAFVAAKATGRTVYAPAGSYAVNLSHSSSTTPFHMIGVPGRTFLKAFADGSAIITVDATANSVAPMRLYGLTFQGVTGHTNTKGLLFKGGWTGTSLVISDFHSVEKCDFDGTSNFNFTSAIEIHGRMIYSVFRDINIKFAGTTHGINVIQNGTGSGALNEYDGAFNNNLFHKVRVANAKGRGYSFDYTRTTSSEVIFQSTSIVHGAIEGCGTDIAVTDSAGVYAKNAEAFSIIGNHFETNSGSVTDAKGANVRLTGTYAQGFDIRSNELLGSQYGVYVDATLAFGTIGSGNRYNAATKAIYVATSHAQSDVKIVDSAKTAAATLVADINGDTHASYVGLSQQWDSEALAGATTLDVTGKSLVMLTDGTAQTLSKMTGGILGQVVTIYNAGSGTVTLTNAAGSPNDLINHGQAAQYLFISQTAQYLFNGTRWIQVNAQQISSIYGGAPGGSFSINASASSNGNIVMNPNAGASGKLFFNGAANSSVDASGNAVLATQTLKSAAPTVAASQVGLGSTTATSATAGTNGAVPAQVDGYLIINVAGTVKKIPYFNT